MLVCMNITGRAPYIPYLYVGKDKASIMELKKKLHKNFSMKELREDQHILGMRIQQDRSQEILWIAQMEYVRMVLQIFNMDKSKPTRTPPMLSTSIQLTSKDSPSPNEEKDKIKWIPYALVIGSLKYTMMATQLDLAYAIQVTSRYMLNSINDH